MSSTQRIELELEILNTKKEAHTAELQLRVHEYNNSMPTAHPGTEYPEVMEGAVRELNWEQAKLDVAISEKRLELFEAGGTLN